MTQRRSVTYCCFYGWPGGDVMKIVAGHDPCVRCIARWAYQERQRAYGRLCGVEP